MMREYDKKMFLEYAEAFDYSEDIKDGCVPYKSDEELKKDMKDNWTLKDFHSMYGFTHKCSESGQEIKPGRKETMLKETMKDENEPKKFIVEFTTKTHPDVVKQDFEKINKFIQENVGNITEKITLKHK